MTTPAMSYYAAQISNDPALRRKYRRHQWRGWHSADRITSFTLMYSSDIYEYRKGQLIFRKNPPNPSWNAPAEYTAPVEIPLTASQQADIRRFLQRIPFAGMHTDPCSFVNLEADCMIIEHFVCKFWGFGSFEFADQHHSGNFSHLIDLLVGICQRSEIYRRIQAMERQIFHLNRFDTASLPVIPHPVGHSDT